MLLKEGIHPINKPAGKTSFSLISVLRRLTKIRKIGHAGTLDPFADGVMILLVGKTYTKQAEKFLSQDKEYLATLHLGKETTTYDPEGEVIAENSYEPTFAEIEEALCSFQGKITQIPPMYSAKKVGGKKLYQLARRGIVIKRDPVEVILETKLLAYNYPELQLQILCSKGTYIRTLAHDLGQMLTCGAYLKKLTRTKCGPYVLENCLDGKLLY